MRKTSTSLAALKVLKKKGMVGKIFIIAPLRVCYGTWPKEMKKWTDFKDFTYEILHGTKKDQALNREADIYLINPEGLDWLFGAKKEKKIVRGKERTIVTVDMKRIKSILGENPLLLIDELTKFKKHDTNRFQLMKQVIHLFSRRWGLTGSPAANGLMGLFGQCYMLDQGRSLGQYITHYRSQYFMQVNGNHFMYKPLPGAEDRIYERISPLFLRLDAADYLELPQLIENNIKVDLPESVMEIYRGLEDDLITKVDEDVVVAKNAAVASGKCRQVASGGLYATPEVEDLIKKSKDQREWYTLHDEKTDALEDLIDELQGNPLLVAYDFEHDLDRLRKRFGARDGVVFLSDVPMKKFSDLIDRWNKGEIAVLFTNPIPAAHGLNLQENSQHVCWYSLTWDYEIYDQFNRRVLRDGNKAKRVFVHHILARDTVDEAILYALKSKYRGQEALFDALKMLAKQRRK